MAETEYKKYVIEFKLYDGTTRKVSIEIPLGEKGEPGYTPVRGVDYWTEADQIYIIDEATSKLVATVEPLKTAAEAAAQRAETAAQAASTSEQNAAASKQSAENSASEAEQYAQNASMSEANASNYAKAAEESKNAALGSEQRAKTSEDKAEQAALETRNALDDYMTRIEESTTAATEAAQTASQHASSAETKAGDAQTYSNNAFRYASESKTYMNYAEAAAEKIPTPCAEVAGKALFANEAGDGYEFGDAISVQSAVPGQMIVVKTVDENGKPIEWEAVDVPEIPEVSVPDGVVLYTEQSLLDEEKLQARENIGILEPLIGKADDIKPKEVLAALQEGRDIVITYTDDTYGDIEFTGFSHTESSFYVIATCITRSTSNPLLLQLRGQTVVNRWYFHSDILAEYGDTSGGSSATPDWNAAEGEPGHILNRPFYSTIWEGTVLPEITVVIDPETGEGSTPDVISLTIGSEYTVNWNGVPYQCVAQDISEFFPGGIALGDLNPMLGQEPTGIEPFTLIAFPPEMAGEEGVGIVIGALDGSESVTISITGQIDVVHKMDNKYLNLGWLPTIEKGVALLEKTVAENSVTVSGELASPVTVGQVVHVEYDSVRYECTVAEMDDYVVIGNQSLLDESFQNSGEPFILAILNGTNVFCLFADGGSHEITIYDFAQDGEIYNRIPIEFFPEEYFDETLRLQTDLDDLQTDLDEKITKKAEKSKPEFSGSLRMDTCVANGSRSVAIGVYTIASGHNSLVCGAYNIEDPESEYWVIVGNGNDRSRSNAYTLDRYGNAWHAGSVEGKAIILSSTSGKRFKITVDDSGNITATEVTA